MNEIGKIDIEIIPQYTIGKQIESGKNLVWEFKFGQVSVSEHPRHLEDGKYDPLFPHESRIRNLTYSTELFADLTVSKKELEDYYIENPATGQREKKVKQVLKEFQKKKVEIGKVPVMLRSRFC